MPPAPAFIRARVETDADDATIQTLIDEAVADIELRHGPYRNVSQPVTVDVEGRRRRLDILRPIDPAQTITVVEHWVADALDIYAAEEADSYWPQAGDTATTLAADDYRIWNAGRTVERLFTGTHPAVYWGARVVLTYVPIDDTARRDEVAAKLTILGLSYQGLIEQKVGDTQITFGLRSGAGGGSPLVYVDERDRLLGTLQARQGLMLR